MALEKPSLSRVVKIYAVIYCGRARWNRVNRYIITVKSVAKVSDKEEYEDRQKQFVGVERDLFFSD